MELEFAYVWAVAALVGAVFGLGLRARVAWIIVPVVGLLIAYFILLEGSEIQDAFAVFFLIPIGLSWSVGVSAESSLRRLVRR